MAVFVEILIFSLTLFIILSLGGAISYRFLRQFQRKKPDSPEDRAKFLKPDSPEDRAEFVTLGRINSFEDFQSFNLPLLPTDFESAKRLSLCFKKRLVDGSKFVSKFYFKTFTIEESEFRLQVGVFSIIKHPHLLKIVALYFTNNGDLTILSPYMCGGSLADILLDERKKRRLTWNWRLYIAKCIARGLKHLNEKHSICHGNVKASNILVDDDMDVKLGDWGHRYLLNNEGEVELVSHADDRYFHSDVYSLGLVMIELLTGKLIDDELRKCSRIAIAQGSSTRVVLGARMSPNLVNLGSFIDESIGAQLSAADKPQLQKFFFTAIQCLYPVGNRPNIIDICRKL